jgi:KaiC/GvpD/RAD55 family RecA-like ATPase
MERTKTGIFGFDDLCQGGLPKGNSAILCGAPGTGKTIFGLEYLYRGALEFSEPGLYVTIEENASSLKEQAIQFGWDFDKIADKVNFLKVPIDTMDVDVTGMIEDAAKSIGAKRIVVDSLSILAINAQMYNLPLRQAAGGASRIVFDTTKTPPPMSEHQMRQFVYLFVTRISEIGATALFVADSPANGEYLTRDTVSEFVSDAIIRIEMRDYGKTLVRTIQIIKMRSTVLSPGYSTVEITDKGLKVEKFSY